MIRCCNLKYSELKNKPVLDSEGENVGRIIDFVFHYEDNKIILESMLLGGSRFEEFLESIGMKPDVDPIINVESIDEIGDEVKLSISQEQMKTTLNSELLHDNDMTLSKLSRLPIVDSDGFKIGRITDVWFDNEDKIWLVIGGGFVEEILEKLKAQPDIDPIVPEEHIKNISEKEICLKWTKYQLESTAEEEFDKQKRELSSRQEPKDSHYEYLRLIGDTKGGTR